MNDDDDVVIETGKILFGGMHGWPASAAPMTFQRLEELVARIGRPAPRLLVSDRVGFDDYAVSLEDGREVHRYGQRAWHRLGMPDICQMVLEPGMQGRVQIAVNRSSTRALFRQECPIAEAAYPTIDKLEVEREPHPLMDHLFPAWVWDPERREERKRL